MAIAILSQEAQVTRHEDEGNLGAGVLVGRAVHSFHAHVHAEIRKAATELRPLLRALSVQPEFSGTFRPRVRHARVLLRSGRCAGALEELQGL